MRLVCLCHTDYAQVVLKEVSVDVSSPKCKSINILNQMKEAELVIIYIC